MSGGVTHEPVRPLLSHMAMLASASLNGQTSGSWCSGSHSYQREPLHDTRRHLFVTRVLYCRTMRGAGSFLSVLLSMIVTVNTAAAPIVIAHRGASGYRPEHTLEAYRLAIEMGADFIEPDLVSTRDGYLVARHEPEIGATTDVASRPEFAARKRTLTLDGMTVTGWFTVDFTLAELRTLRAIQPRNDRPKEFDGQFLIPTLEEIIDLAQRESKARGRTIGIYPETKHPTWHCELGLALEPRLLETLAAASWTTPDSPVFIQSFESGNLRWLRSRTDVRLIQLLDGGELRDDGSVAPRPRWSSTGQCNLYPQGEVPQDFTRPETFIAFREYVDGLGPWKRHLIGTRRTDATDTTERSRQTVAPTSFVQLAHAAGLQVHPWTFRNEAIHLAADYGDDPAAEYRAFAELGIDAVFTDFPDTAIAAFSRGRVTGR